MNRLIAFLFVGVLMHGADLTVTAGAQITPDKTADNGRFPQDSRIGPSAGLEYDYAINAHHSIGVLADYANTNTRLGDFSINTWTMHRLSVDGAYIYRFNTRRLSPFVKVGIGSLITVSGKAVNLPPVGLDGRLEEIAGAGVSYKLSPRFNAVLEYDCHFFRNPDFTDHTWHPQRNEVSEPKLGIRYSFGRHE